MKKISKSKLFMIVSICVLCISVIGSGYAMYREILFEDLTVETITHGLDYYINYVNGTNITNGTLNPGSNYLTGNNATVELWKNDDTYDIYGQIYLDINNTTSLIQNSNGIKYAVTNNAGAVIGSGTLKGSAGTSIRVASNIVLLTSQQIYTVYIWLDENEVLDSNLTDDVLSVSIRCEATMKPV